jgi:hypothetical protein
MQAMSGLKCLRKTMRSEFLEIACRCEQDRYGRCVIEPLRIRMTRSAMRFARYISINLSTLSFPQIKHGLTHSPLR